MKTCAHCNTSHTPAGKAIHFPRCDTNPDGLHKFCSACLARFPHLDRARCGSCGGERKLSRFPGMDSTKPCLVCNADQDDGEARATCCICGAKRKLSRFPEQDAARPCIVCRPLKAVPGDLSEALNALEGGCLEAGGPLRTITEVLQSFGVEAPSTLAVKAAGAWLRARGFAESAACGKRGYRVVGADPNNAFRQWAEKYGALDALQLSAVDRDRYLRGTEPPVVVRLAMSALTAGLPPYA